MIRVQNSVVDPPPRKFAARTGRKVALCGSHSTSLEDAPWGDPSWEFWGHASSRAWYKVRMDRYFDLHPKACWSRGGKKGAQHPRWLAQNTVPIYMQDKYPEVPASVKYPKGRILLEFADARGYFTNHVAWMIALALTEGVETIGLFGVNYGTEGEYENQRGSCEYWLGRASGMGVRIILPEQCSLLRVPALLYGYESHDEATGLLKPEYKRRPQKGPETIQPILPGQPIKRAEPPEHLKALIAREELEHPRPDWAIEPAPEPVPERTDGGTGEPAPEVVEFKLPEGWLVQSARVETAEEA